MQLMNIEWKWNIPNLLSLLRILLVPVFIILYLLSSDERLDLMYWSFGVLILSGVTDSLDGIIARKCNQITDLGKLFSIVITFLGVGMVAIPTGIISAGFVDQYSRVKRLSKFANETDVRFVQAELSRADPWTGRTVRALGLPSEVILAAIRRDGRTIAPGEDMALRAGDILVLGAKPLDDDLEL